MIIEATLAFGKYKGLSLKQIFQGVSTVDRIHIEKYINHKLNIDYAINPSGLIGEVLRFEISDTLIRATPIDSCLDGNYEKSISALFKKGTTFMDRVVGNISFEEFIAIEDGEMHEDTRLICGGNPEYLDWCINTIKWFYIDPTDLLALQKLPVYRFKEMEVVFKIEDIYSYKPHFTSEKYRFPDSTIKKNKQKYQALNHDEFQKDDYKKANDYERDNFDAMTDGQLGSYDEFEGSSDDIDNWAGR